MPWRSATRQLVLPRVLNAGESRKRTLQDIFFFFHTPARSAKRTSPSEKSCPNAGGKTPLHSRDDSRLIILSRNQGDPVVIGSGPDLEGGQHRYDGDPHR